VKVVAYLRVSTEQQVRIGYGLEAQRADIKRWARAEGHHVVAWCSDEGISGSNGIETRAGLFDAIAAVKDGSAAAIVFTSLDRLARELTQQEGVLAEIWAAGGKVFALGDGGEILEDDPDDPMRKAIRQMRGVFAELERGLIRQRMAKGRAVKAAQGGYIGGAPPLGYRSAGGQLTPEPVEALAVDRIRNGHKTGLSLRAIAADLETAGLRTKRGATWHPTTIARVLARERR
jgi:DNA invertase Pin-like site-specific DNA recombinase